MSEELIVKDQLVLKYRELETTNKEFSEIIVILEGAIKAGKWESAYAWNQSLFRDLADLREVQLKNFALQKEILRQLDPEDAGDFDPSRHIEYLNPLQSPQK